MKRLKSHFEMAELISSALKGELSPDDSEKLRHWIDESEENRRLWEKLTDADYLEEHLKNWHEYESDSHWERMQSDVLQRQNGWRILSRKSVKYAAVLFTFLCMATIAWFFYNHKNNQAVHNKIATGDVYIMPQGKVAQLVLGNGRIINLNDSLQQTITTDDGTEVQNKKGGLKYSLANGSGQDRKVRYNTLKVPRGGEYRVTLSDGTAVWLNAASSLRYPAQFIGKERKVYLSGEAYFEVAKDDEHPFIVETGATDITVLGTKFDVSAYTDDLQKKIILAEGSVRVEQAKGNNRTNENAILKPGYGAFIEGNDIRVTKVNVQAALAWKNGMFIFDGESLGNIMKQISRWYDVDVKYDNGVDTLFHFTGRVQRYENISELLHLIALTGKVKFNIKEKEVQVVPL